MNTLNIKNITKSSFILRMIIYKIGLQNTKSQTHEQEKISYRFVSES